MQPISFIQTSLETNHSENFISFMSASVNHSPSISEFSSVIDSEMALHLFMNFSLQGLVHRFQWNEVGLLTKHVEVERGISAGKCKTINNSWVYIVRLLLTFSFSSGITPRKGPTCEAGKYFCDANSTA